MKKVLDAILVVEGKTDVAFLSNYIDAEFVITNGSDIPESTIDYLKEASKSRNIIVLTDPDFPGKKIRDTLDKEIPNLKHCFIDKEHAIKHHKVGVAEADIDIVLESLEHQFVQKRAEGSLKMSDLIDLGLTCSNESAELRNKVCKFFHLGFANAKTLLKRLNALNISKEELGKILNDAR